MVERRRVIRKSRLVLAVESSRVEGILLELDWDWDRVKIWYDMHELIRLDLTD